MHRRSFLRSLAAAPAAGLLCPGAFAQQAGGQPQAPPPLFKPTDAANSPIGVAKGIHPGRVAWIRDANATSWDGATGHWWDDASTDQKVVGRMFSRVLQDLTGQKNDKQAWDALFRSFNETHKGGNSGYRAGEKIAIKINCNQDRAPEWGTGLSRSGDTTGTPVNGLASPHAVVALVSQLIAAGVPGEDITIYDVINDRNIGQPIYTRIRANSGRDFQAVKFLVNNDYKFGGRIFATVDKSNPVRFSNPEAPPLAYLAKEVTEAKYLVNLALLRPHTMAGATMIGKSHFGSVHIPDKGGWTPQGLHAFALKTRPMGSYHVFVDLMGHPHLSGKTVLFMLDGLYSAAHQEGNVQKFASFGDHWTSSILASQDPVAIDSVGLDILRSEPRCNEVRGNVDNYLHEASQAGKPPSGTVYDPTKSGTPLASLGVHEHWNNATERKYSRNLGRKEGIELIASL
jgi:hypothetical protein